MLRHHVHLCSLIVTEVLVPYGHGMHACMHTLYTNLALQNSEAKRGLAKTNGVCAKQVFGSLPTKSVPRKALLNMSSICMCVRHVHVRAHAGGLTKRFACWAAVFLGWSPDSRQPEAI